MIIDCHCHAGEGDGLTGPWDTRASLRDFMRWTLDAGITRIEGPPEMVDAKDDHRHSSAKPAGKAGAKDKAAA